MYTIEITASRLSEIHGAIKESGYYKESYNDINDARECLLDAFRYLRDTFGGVKNGTLKLRPLELEFDRSVAEIIEL